MEEDLHNEYRYMDEDDRGFTRRLLFLDLIETVTHNRKVKRGPQTIKQIIHNDLKEFTEKQNYEACWLYRDTRDHFQIDIEHLDKGWE